MIAGTAKKSKCAAPAKLDGAPAAQLSQNPEPKSRSLLFHAQRFLDLGLSIFRLPPGSKVAADAWKNYQTKRASESQLRHWFGDDEKGNIAVVMGAVSRWLVCRDFDDARAYEEWAASNSGHAITLPTVRTARGYHVYFRMTAATVAALRASRGSPDGTGAIKLPYGELRCGHGCYCLLPPSIHPDGPTYEWIVELGTEIPVVDPTEIGLIPHSRHSTTQYTQQAQQTQQIQAIKSNGTVSTVSAAPTVWDCSQIHSVVAATIPEAYGQRNACIFAFARKLKAIPELADKKVGELRAYFKLWHALAKPRIRTKSWEINWLEFATAWQNTKFPDGTGALVEIYGRAQQQPAAEAIEFGYDSPKMRVFVAFCRELQALSGEKPFFIGCRAAADVFQVDATTVWEWLRVMCVDGLLECVSKGSLGRHKASEYRWLPPLDVDATVASTKEDK